MAFTSKNISNVSFQIDEIRDLLNFYHLQTCHTLLVTMYVI